MNGPRHKACSGASEGFSQ
ncbi:hypothetical protein [uncultured Pseudomonas sp.]